MFFEQNSIQEEPTATLNSPSKQSKPQKPEKKTKVQKNGSFFKKVGSDLRKLKHGSFRKKESSKKNLLKIGDPVLISGKERMAKMKCVSIEEPAMRRKSSSPSLVSSSSSSGCAYSVNGFSRDVS